MMHPRAAAAQDSIVPNARSAAELTFGQSYVSETVDPAPVRLTFTNRNPATAATISLVLPRSYVTSYLVGRGPDRDLLSAGLTVVYPSMRPFVPEKAALAAGPWHPREQKRALEDTLLSRRLEISVNTMRAAPGALDLSRLPSACQVELISPKTYKLIKPEGGYILENTCFKYTVGLSRENYLLIEDDGSILAMMGCGEEKKQIPRSLECTVEFIFKGWYWSYFMKIDLLSFAEDVHKAVYSLLSYQN